MPVFGIQWRRTGTAVAVELLTVVALGFAVVGYVEWSSDAAVIQFMGATKSSASDPNHSSESPIQSLNGRTGCALGKRSLPTQLIPLP